MKTIGKNNHANFNDYSVKKLMLPILQEKFPTLTMKEITFKNRTSQLFIRKHSFLYYDKHVNYPVPKSITVFLDVLKTLVKK